MKQLGWIAAALFLIGPGLGYAQQGERQPRGPAAQSRQAAPPAARSQPRAERRQRATRNRATRSVERRARQQQRAERRDARRTRNVERQCAQRQQRAGRREAQQKRRAANRERAREQRRTRQAERRDRVEQRADRRESRREQRVERRQDRREQRAERREDRREQRQALNIDQRKRERVRNEFRERRQNLRHYTNVDIDVYIGRRLPSDWVYGSVPAYLVDVYPSYRDYRWAWIDDRYVIVEPQSYEIVGYVEADSGAIYVSGGGSVVADACDADLVLSESYRTRILRSIDRRVGIDFGNISIGFDLPERVNLYTFPSELRNDLTFLSGCRYIPLQDERIAIVAPQTREVVAILAE